MSSLKMTFSLASLIVLIAFSLVMIPAEAAEVTVAFGDFDTTVGIGFAVLAATNTFDKDAASSNKTLPVDAVDIDNTGLSNLYDDFRSEGGVLYTLIARTSVNRHGEAATDDAVAAKDVVISEIMWGIDEGTTDFDDRTQEQFFELYNTVVDADAAGSNPSGGNQAIDLENWIIHSDNGKTGIFYGKDPGDIVELLASDGKATSPLTLADSETAANAKAKYIIVDQVGNLEVVGPWVNDVGQSGNTSTTGDAGKDIVSMYRKIDWKKVEGTDAKRLEGIPVGTKKSSWAPSVDAYAKRLLGTPGEKNFVGLKASEVDSIAHSPVIINEIGNLEGDSDDWLELRNVTDAEVNLNNWQIGEITGGTNAGSEATLVTFSGDPKIPAKGILLVVNTDPYDNDDRKIAAGTRVNGAHLDTTATKSRYYVDSNFKLQDSGKTLLVLRNGNDKSGTHEKIVDLTGTNFITDNAKNTQIWPLRGRRIDGDDWGHTDVVKGTDEEDFRAEHVYQRINAGRGVGKETWERRGYTGVGYKRSADDDAKYGGTPGFDNGAVKENLNLTADPKLDAPVKISEIMYQTGRNMPQWIELFNTSATKAVNLNGWKLKIETSRDDAAVDIRKPTVTIQFGGTIIPPNQPVLIVSTTTPQASDEIDHDHRIIDLWSTQKSPLEVDNRRFQLLSTTAFKLTLMQKGYDSKKDPNSPNFVSTTKAADEHHPADVVGNLGADGMAMWELPMKDGDDRSSIIRRYDKGKVARDGTLPVWSGMGSIEDQEGLEGGEGNAGWVLASATNFTYESTYYGNRDDLGTPGYQAGSALPVSLSKFRPERLESGEIVIRWITESELNNAGFNILRSEKRDGQFTKINTSLIAGQGTTSERTTYSLVDTSAKPNVVYYYQIQDVSLDGEVQTLRQSRLKGDVSPAGKLTTIWGEIKALQ